MFSGAGGGPAGGPFIGLTCIYATDTFVSLRPRLPGDRTSRGACPGLLPPNRFPLTVGFRLICLMFAVVLSTILNYSLPLWRPRIRGPGGDRGDDGARACIPHSG